jgi:hypothetical protein
MRWDQVLRSYFPDGTRNRGSQWYEFRINYSNTQAVIRINRLDLDRFRMTNRMDGQRIADYQPMNVLVLLIKKLFLGITLTVEQDTFLEHSLRNPNRRQNSTNGVLRTQSPDNTQNALSAFARAVLVDDPFNGFRAVPLEPTLEILEDGSAEQEE